MSEEITKLEISIIPKFLDSALTPVAKEAGERLADIVSLVFTPIIKAKAKRDKNIELFLKELDEKVNKIPEENLTEPPLSIVGPALDNVFKFYHDEEHLRQMYSTLIASSMNCDNEVHPSYIEIIRQLSKQDAIVFSSLLEKTFIGDRRFITRLHFCLSIEVDFDRFFLNSAEVYSPLYLFKDEKLVHLDTALFKSLYLLQRLGLINIRREKHSLTLLEDYKVTIEGKENMHEWCVYKNSITLTQYGLAFAHVCCENAGSEEDLIHGQEQYLKNVLCAPDHLSFS